MEQNKIDICPKIGDISKIYSSTRQGQDVLPYFFFSGVNFNVALYKQTLADLDRYVLRYVLIYIIILDLKHRFFPPHALTSMFGVSTDSL